MIVVRRGRALEVGQRRSDLDDLLRALVVPSGIAPRKSSGSWRPPVDVYEEPDRVVIVSEIAGMDREAIDISIEGDHVLIRGTRPDPAVCEQRSFHEARIAYGAFAAEVKVPLSIDSEHATATYENGFLTIVLPRVRARTIVATSPRSETDSGRSIE